MERFLSNAGGLTVDGQEARKVRIWGSHDVSILQTNMWIHTTQNCKELILRCLMMMTIM